MNLREIRQALLSRGLRPLERFGQNFLHDENVCRLIADVIIESLQKQPFGRVLEVGPGLGALTEHLLSRGVEVHAVEIDLGLSRYLQDRFVECRNFHLVQADILEYLPRAMEQSWAAIVGNLPYNISTPILFSVLRAAELPRTLVFMVQEELADRIRARPGTPNYGAPSVILQRAYRIEFVRRVPCQLFYPRPKVHSAVLRFERIREQARDPEFEWFQAVVRRAFQYRRKQLRTIFACDLDCRAEELAPDEWWEFAQSLPRGGDMG
ncbi:MAG: 16S rRNA (adenine(1518)-N(6)/adenine(1519)-N(6))-dimethyltransferase RsmA [Methylacidiphilales bacterium]|nr:16S rRNA (adenine(1518)-N(6)/adenine(1519)-N(6))-dimethyltransferase RsmA [Candidatus Methylacidiphilales bacterium]MDW8349066.1 16S rRNA (adenine(1518)-N(6)/adenine(1519)-N(6))-dimethyltransferase RsmA [Verrucomicrobiae bacterium]